MLFAQTVSQFVDGKAVLLALLSFSFDSLTPYPVALE